MRAVKQIAALFSAVGAMLVLGLWLWLTSDTVIGWQTWLFRAAHQVSVVAEEDGGTRSVAFVLRPREDVGRAVTACAHSFDKMLLQDGTFVHCVAYASAEDMKLQAAQPERVYEKGRAIQMPYNSAKNAQILLNSGEHCVIQSDDYLPEYVRGYGG